MKVPSGGVPYFIFFLTGQVPWNFFDGPLIRGSRGLEANRQLLTKLYVPRIILPLAQMTAGMVEPVIIALVLARRASSTTACNDGVWYVQASPRLFACARVGAARLAFAFSLSLWTSVWQARARDARFVLRYVLGFWLFLTPVIYPLSVVPAGYPLAGVPQSADRAGRNVQVGDAAGARALVGLVRLLGGGDRRDVLRRRLVFHALRSGDDGQAVTRTLGGLAPLSRRDRDDAARSGSIAACSGSSATARCGKMYRRTVLGWLWLFINPLFPIALRALIFGGLLGVGSNGLPYFLFLLAGTVVWDMFATSLMWGTRALEMNRDLTDQIYHPRAILPFGNMAPALLDLALKAGVFLAAALMFYTLRDGRVVSAR